MGRAGLNSRGVYNIFGNESGPISNEGSPTNCEMEYPNNFDMESASIKLRELLKDCRRIKD